MMCRRSLNIAAAVAALVVPLTALAQGPTGTVTTDPVHPAPALGMPLLVVLVVVMAGVALYGLRRTVGGPIVGAVLFAAVTALAGLGYASSGVTINGAECTRQTTSPFLALGFAELMSECPNQIQIVDIELSCAGPFAPSPNSPLIPDCRVGQILSNGDICRLPGCL